MTKIKGLRRRWLRNTVLVFFGFGMLCAAAIVLIYGMHCYKTEEADLKNRAELTAGFFSGYQVQENAAYYEALTTYVLGYKDEENSILQLVSADGVLLESSGDGTSYLTMTEEFTCALQSGEACTYIGEDAQNGQRILAASVPLYMHSGEVLCLFRCVMSTQDMDKRILAVVLLCVGAVLLLTVCAFINRIRYIRKIFSPLEQIIEKAAMIADGSYGIQIQVSADKEIAQLADTINELSLQINQNEKMQTEFISSLSHELRTPLTAITGWSETLLGSDNLDRNTRRGVKIIHEETIRLTEMVLELLDFTRIQDGRMTLNIEATDIRAVFEDTVYMYGSRLARDEISLQLLENDDEIPEMSCDPKRLRQVFLNILDNAAKHGGEGKRINAAMNYENGEVVVRIRDYGPGIPEDELGLVKKKFYKGSSKARGSGIGLAVCDEIVERHGGQLTLENAEGGGTLVTIWLPVAQ